MKTFFVHAIKAFAAGSTLLLSMGCLAQEIQNPAEELKKPVKEKAVTYTVKPDSRDCAPPECGGWYLTPVNQYSSPTADEDESFQKSLLATNSIYVSNIDYKDLHLKRPQVKELDAILRSGQGLLAGYIVNHKAPGKQETKKLDAQVAWTSPTKTHPIGPYLKVSSSGIVCVTTPCPYFTVKHLNVDNTVNYDELIFDRAELDRDQEARAWQAVSSNGLILTGVRFFPQLQTGVGVGISATKVFFPFGGKKVVPLL